MEMIEALIVLATEPVEEAGFGLNLNILQTNLVNLAIVIGVVVYFGSKILGASLAERRSQIEAAIQDAEKRKKEAAAALADQQQKLAQAQAEANRIRAAAEETAAAAREAVMAQAAQDVERMKAAAAQDLTAQQERIIRELRQRIATLALERAEAQLKSGLNDSTQQHLIDRSIAMLGGRS